jgi:hypothetical protein
LGVSNRLGEKSAKSLIDVLYEKHDIKEDLFAICFAQENGTLTIGGFNETLHETEVQYIPMLPDVSHYGVTIKGIQIAGVLLNITSDISQAIVDSGTTFTYLASNIFTSFWDVLETFCAEDGNCFGEEKTTTFRDRCWTFDGRDDEDLEAFFDSFPLIVMQLDGADVVWEPVQYLYRSY